jgi:hypothetical protein
MQQPVHSEASLNFPAAMLDYATRIVEQYLANTRDWREVWTYNWQCIRAMAYLFVHPQSRLRASARLGEQISALFTTIAGNEATLEQRLAGHVAETRALLGPDLCARLLPGADEYLARRAEVFISETLAPLRHVTHFVSANLYTSTNHVAVFACSVYRIGEQLGRADWMALARDVWNRLCADQHSDGYWEETTGGPTPLYNNLTMCGAGRMVQWTGAENYAHAARNAALFQRRFSYPDGCNLETIDGRVRYCSYEHDMWGGFVHSDRAEGRAFLRRKLATRLRLLPEGDFGVHAGEVAALMCENHQYWNDGPLGRPEVDRPHYVEQLQVPGAVRKQGPWFISMQGITHFPHAYGFTIDRSSLFSLWHEKTGLIVNGSGELGPTVARTFGFDVKPQISHIPERTTIAMGSAGGMEPARLSAEYAGGTANIEITFASEQEVKVRASVAAKMDRYPIVFTMQLERREGHRINGSTLDKDAKTFTDTQLAGKLETDCYTMEFPSAGARLVWPHDPFNPYDGVNFRSPPEKYVTLLQLPIGPEGVEVTIRIRR